MTGNAIDNFLLANPKAGDDIGVSTTPSTSTNTQTMSTNTQTMSTQPDYTTSDGSSSDGVEGLERVKIAMALCLLVGFIQVG